MTLIEVAVTALVLSLVTLALSALLIQSLKGWAHGTSAETAVSRTTLAMQRLANEIRDARSAQVVSGVLVVTFPTQIVDTGTGERVYDLSSDDPVTRSYYVTGGNLVRSRGSVITVIEHGITSAVFGASGGTVTATLTSTDQEGTKTSTKELTSRIALRNFRS